MKKMVLMAALIAACAISAASAQVGVRGYYRQDGTYVAPYVRTAPDSNPYNNYSTQGNVNPYTGQPGTVQPYSSPYGSSYGQGYVPRNRYGSSYGQ